MRVCDIITVGANSVHPKRQMVFDDTKISTKNRTTLIIEKEKIICTTISNLKGTLFYHRQDIHTGAG